MILLDTDVMIDLLRQYPPALSWLEDLEEEEVLLPGFVGMELIQGCRNKGELKKVERMLNYYDLVWPTPETCDQALVIFSRNYLTQGLGLLDAMIGQMAVSLDCSLYTFNQKHYKAIPRLSTLQPYQRNA
jgi:predicted nucleic acid-binding protein